MCETGRVGVLVGWAFGLCLNHMTKFGWIGPCGLALLRIGGLGASDGRDGRGNEANDQCQQCDDAVWLEGAV